MDEQCIAAGRRWLDARPGWAPEDRLALLRAACALWPALPPDRPCVMGLAGPPGSGKSTLAQLLCTGFSASGAPGVVLSLDDYYLSREDRVQKAASVHPLYAQRGVPGTHDLDALLADIDALVAGEQQRALPLFDKSTDDRNPEARHIDLTEPAGLLIVEGWCIGALPQTDSELAASINDIEARDDPDGSFRRRVNRATARYRQALATRLDAFWYLRPPAWQQVLEWRWQQECDLPSDRRRLRDPADVAAFLALFQRLSEHMQQLTAPGANAWADLIIPLDDLHRPQLETAHEPA